LARLAAAAAERAHAPYSRYRVGAALLDAEGRVHTGCNVENASYGLTLCAERNAIVKAVSEGARRFRGIAVAAGSAAQPPLPCGACRQVLAEFCPDDFPVHLVPLDAPGEIRTLRLSELLPHPFRLGEPPR
jgi:cytidine deaminase